MGKKVNQEKLLAKIAALTGSDAQELKEKAEKSNLYSHDEMVFESQAVINYFKAKILKRPPVRKQGETLLSYTSRVNEYEASVREWKVRDCLGCSMPFAYAYSYEGVAYCSLDCMDAELRKIGLKVTRGRDLRKRWGLYHPAIVPSEAYENLKKLYPWAFEENDSATQQPSSTSEFGMNDADVG